MKHPWASQKRAFWKRMEGSGPMFCFYCTKVVTRDVPVDAPDRATIDHVIPEAAGGSNRRRNWVVSCWSCNQRKGNDHG